MRKMILKLVKNIAFRGWLRFEKRVPLNEYGVSLEHTRISKLCMNIVKYCNKSIEKIDMYKLRNIKEVTEEEYFNQEAL